MGVKLSRAQVRDDRARIEAMARTGLFEKRPRVRRKWRESKGGGVQIGQDMFLF